MADDVLDETIHGLWRTLIRLVPTHRRQEASALANAIHHFVEGSGYARGHQDERRARAERDEVEALRLRALPCATDAAPTWKDELRSLPIFDKPDTPH